MKKVFQYIFVIFVSILLAGCGKCLITTTLNSNGSGTNEIILALDTNVIAPGNFLWIGMDSGKSSFEKAGAEIRPWHDGTYQGFKAKFTFHNVDELTQQIANPGSDISMDILQSVNYWFDENNLAHFVAKGDRSDSFDTGSEVKFTLKMPGRIISYTEETAARQSNSTTLVYDLTKLNGKTFDIEVISKVNRFSWIYIILSILGLLLIIMVIGLMIRSRKNKNIEAMKQIEDISPSH